MDIDAVMVSFRIMCNQALEAADKKFKNEIGTFLREIEKWAEETAVSPKIEAYVEQCIVQERIVLKKDFCLGIGAGVTTALARKAFDAYLHQIPTTKRTFSKVKKSGPEDTTTQHQDSPKKPVTKARKRATGPKRIWVQFVQGGAPGLGKRA